MRLLVFLLFLLSRVVLADCVDELEEATGYTIFATKTIAGWYDEDGDKGDDFEGCDYGRTIIFTDNTRLNCSTYNYTYEYLPKALILAKKVEYQGKTLYLFKMLVDNELYDMSR